MLLEATLWENRILGHQTRPPAVKGWFIDRKAARADTERIMDDYDVRAPGPDTLAVALSGGNQQKLIVGREMESAPRRAARRPPHPRASTSARRRPSGNCSRTPGPKGWASC